MKKYFVIILMLMIGACILIPDEEYILGNWYLSEMELTIEAVEISNRSYSSKDVSPYVLRITENYAYCNYTNIQTGSNSTTANSYVFDKAERKVTFGTSVMGYNEATYSFTKVDGNDQMTLRFEVETTNMKTKWLSFND